MSQKPDDLSLLLDHWIIVRKDGTPVLNGKPEDFEDSLRLLLWMEKTGAKWGEELPEDFPEPTCVLIRPSGDDGVLVSPRERGVDSFDI